MSTDTGQGNDLWEQVWVWFIPNVVTCYLLGTSYTLLPTRISKTSILIDNISNSNFFRRN